MFCSAGNYANAQMKHRNAGMTPVIIKKDSVSAKGPMSSGDALKPYKELINAKAESHKGFITIHKIDEKYYLEVPDAILGREILVVNKIARAPADFRVKGKSSGYAGDIVNQQMFHFSKGAGNRFFIRYKSYSERAQDSSANGLARSLERNNYEPILNSYAVKAINDSLHSSVIEITDQLNQDNLLFGFSAEAKKTMGLSAMVNERSFIGGVTSTTEDISFRFTRTYNKSNLVAGTLQLTTPYTMELRTDVFLLPQISMRPRLADSRTGYNQISYIDFDSNPMGSANKSIILRWRLEPSDRKAYFAGVLTEPLQPIKIYIDSAFPSKWKPYVKAGIESWNAAFETAGFKNAIQVVQESTVSEDIHRNMVVFLPGEGNDPSNIISDPRSGEIISMQLRFYLNTIDRLYKKYFIQAGALDKAANKPVFDDQLMGRIIKAYTMHTMGTLLGLGTNTGAANSNPIANLRSNSWLKSEAFNGSATDPVLVNYVVQPEDHVDPENLLPKISSVDKWMINWGYRVIPDKETETLGKWIRNQSSLKPLYVAPYNFINASRQGRLAADPRSGTGDLGDDVIQASTLGIRNLKQVVPHLLDWTSEPATNNEKAATMYVALLKQYDDYVRDVILLLGGMYTNPKKSDQPGDVYTYVPAATQKKAVKFLHEQVFQSPQWLMNKELITRTTAYKDTLMNVMPVQQKILKSLMDNMLLSILQAGVRFNPKGAYQPIAYLEDLGNDIFSELRTTASVSLPRRELQRVYIKELKALLVSVSKFDNDLPAVVNAHAKSLLQLLNRSRLTYKGFGHAHVTALYEELYVALSDKAIMPANK